MPQCSKELSHPKNDAPNVKLIHLIGELTEWQRVNLI